MHWGSDSSYCKPQFLQIVIPDTQFILHDVIKTNEMKTRYKIMLVGVIVFVLGLSIMLIDVNVKSISVMQTIEEIFLVIGLVSTGLIMIGIATMYDFAKRKYDVRN